MSLMAIVIAGGTGFLGSALVRALALDGHVVAVLTRTGGQGKPGPARLIEWKPDGSVGPWVFAIDGAEAVINLAGESIAGRRWTAAQKKRILESRVKATRSLAEAIRQSAAPPPVFVSGSAVGYYGALGDEIVTEDHAPGRDFLADVCVQWEREAARAAGARTRVVSIRTGLVLERDGGALPQMLPPFWFGAGGRVGSGRQYWPWVHLQDWVDLVRFSMRTLAVAGPINLTAPNPVTNREFARTLGRVLRRPALLPAPGFALRILLGEMAGALLLSGQRAMPAKAARLGYRFTFADLETALRRIFP